ncbi:hypothetical protein F4780DRAFT_793574 [Xylariomycetidae sp. FL0641]|nr:hypothetical protein F4780DRAFT_793574 [Xylariomycetidae sp. FL0641]
MMAKSYDYIIVGGGQSGLVVANRLSEDADVRVLVIEAGSDQRTNPSLSTPGLISGAYTHDGFIWPFQSVPQPELNGRHLRQDTGRVLGGSSLTNFMMAMFPSRQNIDAWAKLGNEGWSFDDLAPYFKKSTSTRCPSAAVREQLGGLGYYQASLSGDGPVQLSYDDDYSIVNTHWFQTFANLGLEMTSDPRSGKAIGAFQNPSTIEAGTRTRSSAVTAYYGEAVARRPNLDVLLETRVEKIETRVRPEDGQVVATGVRIARADGTGTGAATTVLIPARREVILAAGALRTPQLLELSGIGDRARLAALGPEAPPVVVHNPHVGEHLQDHLMTAQQFPVRAGVPSTDALRDPARFARAADDYAAARAGPLSGMHISAAYVPVAGREGVLGPAAREALFDAHLGPSSSSSSSEGDDDEEEEFALIRALLATPDEPAVQYMCFPGSLTVTPHPGSLADMFAPRAADPDCIGVMALLNHPFSRGRVHAVSADPRAPPRWDPAYLSHALDAEILARAVQFVETLAGTAPFRDLLDPPRSSSSSSEPPKPRDSLTLDQARRVVRESAVSCFHVCGSARMAPSPDKGVVDPRLRVHGVRGLRVVDASVFPLEPLGNIQTTVYAVAERAADLIKQDRALADLGKPVRPVGGEVAATARL